MPSNVAPAQVEPRSVAIKRRLKTVPMIIVLAFVVTDLIIPLALAAIAIDLWIRVVKRRPSAYLRSLMFGWAYLIADIVGLTFLTITWFTSLGGRNQLHLQRTAFWAQQTWAGFMMGAAKFLFRLNIEVHGQEQAEPGPYIEVIRHSSIVDNVLSAIAISGPLGIDLRYVIRKELLGDPVFDVCGKRLWNHFLDRDSGDPKEIEAIRRLAADMGPKDGALIYPEGTRVSEKRRLKALKAIARNRPERAERFKNLKHCLPPRHGGLLALLDAAPDVDLVLFLHVGLEGIRGIQDALSGGLNGRRTVIQIIRVARAHVGNGEAAAEWLDTTWLAVDDWVDAGIKAIASGLPVPQFVVPSTVTA
jgi:1-acyl-sn-glycerol-3-phosphate acyltransferase